MIGIYVHIPFCAHICPYCDFRKSSIFTPKDIKSFFSKLLDQWETAVQWIPEPIQQCTLYFGGGTPGLFPASYYQPLIEKIKKRFRINEFSLETNPLTNQQAFLKGWQELGVNRITLGAQSLNPHILKFLGRKHTVENILKTIQWARSSEIPSIQVDLIYGLSLERKLSLDQEINLLANEGATGISAYGLTVERRTRFGQTAPSHIQPHLTNDEGFESQYKELHKSCSEKDWVQWEVSNFSLKPCLHNQQYWDGGWYVGLGTGAHGLVPLGGNWGQRYCVGEQPEQRGPGDDILNYSNPSNIDKLWSIVWEPPRTHKQMAEERLFTGLRTFNGLPKHWVEEHFGKEAFPLLENHPKTRRAIEEKKIIVDSEGIRLTWKEKIRSDFWAVELAMVLEYSLVE